jgi:hypothetical protein
MSSTRAAMALSSLARWSIRCIPLTVEFESSAVIVTALANMTDPIITSISE